MTENKSPTSAQSQNKSGPSGFIELNGQMMLVDYGVISFADQQIGILYDDGYIRSTSGQFGHGQNVVPIDDIVGCKFQGIDSLGRTLEFPGETPGPTGSLSYNGQKHFVINGRITTPDHQYLGYFADDGSISLRSSASGKCDTKLDENTQLATIFSGENSKGENFNFEFHRPLSKKDKSYFDNEIIRYFENYEALPKAQKDFVVHNMQLWAKTGLLQIVRKSEGTAALGNVKHGAAGVTGVRTGFVTLDKEEFEKEINLAKKFGDLVVAGLPIKPYIEIRLNMVVAHEFGHQLEFVLSQSTQEQVADLFAKKKDLSMKLFPQPDNFDGTQELLIPQKLQERIFISGYSRTSFHEYFAEAVAAFSVREARQQLRQIDPEIFAILEKIIFEPEKMLRPVFVEVIQILRQSLKIGGEYTDKLLQ